MSTSKIMINGGNANDFLGQSEFFQFMQHIQTGAQPEAHMYMKPGWSYTIDMSENGDKILNIHKPKFKENLREKLSQLRHQRMSRQCAINRVKKLKNKTNDENNITHINNLMTMYESLKGRMSILHPHEALSNVEKFRPIVDELTREYPDKHPLTAYYKLMQTLM